MQLICTLFNFSSPKWSACLVNTCHFTFCLVEYDVDVLHILQKNLLRSFSWSCSSFSSSWRILSFRATQSEHSVLISKIEKNCRKHKNSKKSNKNFSFMILIYFISFAHVLSLVQPIRFVCEEWVISKISMIFLIFEWVIQISMIFLIFLISMISNFNFLSLGQCIVLKLGFPRRPKKYIVMIRISTHEFREFNILAIHLPL